MKVTANIATQKSRLNVLPQMIESIHNQVDHINIWANDFQYWNLLKKYIISNGLGKYKDKVTFYYDKEYKIVNADLADNGKYFPLQLDDEPVIYLTCDDDIIYPPDYVENIKIKMNMYPGHIIAHHGRILLAKGVDYYHAHTSYKFFKKLETDRIIDVAGTGVCAFNTEIFRPAHISNDHRKRMSDLLFSYEAAKAGIPIMCCDRPDNWIQQIPVTDTILNAYKDIPTPVQNELADFIYELRYPNS